ncbi:MAG TPA: hypothetical protein VFY13_06135, partial [Luteolibacter sp.]|nr:hypothetical protein [Luteolibacter sp.]
MESIPSKSGDDHLVIICPKCTERFQVDKSFKGRIAECGECRHEFPINDSVIEKQRKFYPGEKHDPLLKNVNRVSTPLPQASDPNVPDSFGSHSEPVVIGPPSPQRILLAVLSVFIVLITGVMLGFGRAPGGVLDGMSIFNQFIMAGFVTAMATGMLIFAGPRFRVRMLLVGLAMGSLLFTIPLVAWIAQPDGDEPTAPVTRPVAPEDPSDDDNLSVEELRYLIMTKPLDDERERLRKANSTKQAAGLWLRNLYIRNS